MPAHRHRRQHRFHIKRLGQRQFYRHHVLRESQPHQASVADATRRRKQLLLAAGLVILVMVVGLVSVSAYRTTPANTTFESSATTTVVGNTCGAVGSCSAQGNTWGNTYGGVPETVSELAVSSDGYALSSASWEENSHNINV